MNIQLINEVAVAVIRGNQRDKDIVWNKIKSSYKDNSINLSSYLVFKKTLDRFGYFN